jgi:phosphoglycerol transferase MdoB-like AlkP superfamily enzyme
MNLLKFPVQTPFNDPSEPELFKKSAWYTDYCLGKYFAQAKNEPWYANTIFILVADHGHRLPLNRSFDDPLIRRIPMLILGNPFKTGAYRYKSGCYWESE